MSKVRKEDISILTDRLGYKSSGLTFKRDWHIGYYKSKIPSGKVVYYFRHSAVEYVFY